MPGGLLWLMSQTKEQKTQSVISNQGVPLLRRLPCASVSSSRDFRRALLLGSNLPSCWPQRPVEGTWQVSEYISVPSGEWKRTIKWHSSNYTWAEQQQNSQLKGGPQNRQGGERKILLCDSFFLLFEAVLLQVHAVLCRARRSLAAVAYCPSLTATGWEKHRELPGVLLAPQFLKVWKCQTDTDSGEWQTELEDLSERKKTFSKSAAGDKLPEGIMPFC